MKIGNMIRRIRIADGVSQALLAEDLDISCEELERIEQGKKAPKLDVLSRIAERFALPLPLLLLSEEADAPNDEVFCLLGEILDRLLTARIADLEDESADAGTGRAAG